GDLQLGIFGGSRGGCGLLPRGFKGVLLGKKRRKGLCDLGEKSCALHSVLKRGGDRDNSLQFYIFDLCGSMPIYHMSLFKVPMKDIVREMEHLKNHGTDLIGFIYKKMGNGADTSFWEDVWRDDGAFKSLYPRIYALDTCKNITAAVKMSHENVGYSLRRIPRGGIEHIQFLEFLVSMEGVALVDMKDM
nr:RNA-directed DNA polymerase, eukaryota, reverse transcriptase zinc-binding domain protein [Tanacetum cinerariifolium]